MSGYNLPDGCTGEDIDRSCVDFSEEAESHWDDLTVAERWEIGKRQALAELRIGRAETSLAMLNWTPLPPAEKVPF